MRAILSVTVREGYTITTADGRWESLHEGSRILYHSRRGLTPDKNKATRFKTLDYAVRVARRRYRPRLAYCNAPDSRDLQEWRAATIEESKQ